ncbi:hypothetical protein MKW98_015575 [Papaver atlanticum]|uniref:F-box domain-containing protein n=1 Tax=Papaver atlanticum TaxID=357466 RepID=A0AAD4S4H7_9MAGN|nr:hypothetical protein MKW98_015575 [Papaver atlanticum]
MEAQQNIVENLDRISDLPDNIIHHILSFLLIKDVIRTSFLSKRWRYKWTSVPTLEFDGLVFSPKTKFMNFIDSVLLHRTGPGIQTFSLRFGGYYCDSSHLHSWFLAAANHDVRELSISSHTGEAFELPSCIFTCNSLTVLKLNLYNSVVNLPSFIHLPFLKRLQLTSVTFSEDGWNQIFCNSPMLEDVIMEDCYAENLKPLHISSSSLRSLNIDGLLKEQNYCPLNHEIRVYSPRLMSLKFTGYAEKSIYIENMSSLVDATIDLKFNLDIRADIYSSHLIKFLEDISHIKVLTLSSSSIELLCETSTLLGKTFTFSNLNYLKLTAAVNKETVKRVAFVLHSSPKLEFLSIDFFLRRRGINEEESFEPQTTAYEYCIDNLKVVKIKGFRGNENEIALVKSLLENAKILEKMIIVFLKQISANSKLQNQIYLDILLHPRGSPSSEVVCEL